MAQKKTERFDCLVISNNVKRRSTICGAIRDIERRFGPITTLHSVAGFHDHLVPCSHGCTCPPLATHPIAVMIHPQPEDPFDYSFDTTYCIKHVLVIANEDDSRIATIQGKKHSSFTRKVLEGCERRLLDHSLVLSE